MRLKLNGTHQLNMTKIAMNFQITNREVNRPSPALGARLAVLIIPLVCV
jgi:hypothetical protein